MLKGARGAVRQTRGQAAAGGGACAGGRAVAEVGVGGEVEVARVGGGGERAGVWAGAGGEEGFATGSCERWRERRRSVGLMKSYGARVAGSCEGGGGDGRGVGDAGGRVEVAAVGGRAAGGVGGRGDAGDGGREAAGASGGGAVGCVCGAPVAAVGGDGGGGRYSEPALYSIESSVDTITSSAAATAATTASLVVESRGLRGAVICRGADRRACCTREPARLPRLWEAGDEAVEPWVGGDLGFGVGAGGGDGAEGGEGAGAGDDAGDGDGVGGAAGVLGWGSSGRSLAVAMARGSSAQAKSTNCGEATSAPLEKLTMRWKSASAAPASAASAFP